MTVDAASQASGAAPSALSRRAIGEGEMLRIQIRHIDWERHQIAIPGRHAKDAEPSENPRSLKDSWSFTSV